MHYWELGLGSANETYLVTLEWNGKKFKTKTISFCWKGSLF